MITRERHLAAGLRVEARALGAHAHKAGVLRAASRGRLHLVEEGLLDVDDRAHLVRVRARARVRVRARARARGRGRGMIGVGLG